jgi:hydrogenase maturation protein HypF
VVDLRPAVRQIADGLRRGEPPALLAARFHETMAHVIAASCAWARAAGAPATVALSGGCFQSPRLTTRACELLARAGCEVLVHRLVPPNDGGLSLGQAAIAAWRRRGDVPRDPR